MSSTTGFASPHVYNSSYNPAESSRYGHIPSAYIPTRHQTGCETGRSWVDAMNRQPVYANLKNFFTAEAHHRATRSTQVPSYLQAMGGLAAYTAAGQEYLRTHSTQPYPSYNANISQTSCSPIY